MVCYRACARSKSRCSLMKVAAIAKLRLFKSSRRPATDRMPKRPCCIPAPRLVLRGDTSGARGGRGDAAAVVLPALVDLADHLRQPEGDQETDDGPRRVELAAERGELRRCRTGVMVVVQALTEGDQSQQPEVGRVVLEALVAEGMA